MKLRLRAALAVVAATVGAYYLWQLRATGYRFDWTHEQLGYYNYLGRAFAQGRLELPLQPSPQLLAAPNPWDPALDESYKMHDMALYKGRYYLYHGAGPAIMLFTPWLLITGHDLPERFAIFLLCFGGFLFSCGVLIRWLALAGAKSDLPLLVLLLLALGLCTSVPFLLNRVWVYEVAIAGGYFCISGALFFLTRAMQSARSSYWLAASGLAFGMAISCRPHLGLAGLIAMGGLAFYRKPGKISVRGRMAFAAGFALVGAAVALYNFQRFGNPLEFGIRYLLAGPGQNRIRLAPGNILPGLYFWLVCPPEVSLVFPWVRLAYRHPFNSPGYPFPPGYFIEATVGALYLAPFLLAALWMPKPRPRILLWITLGASAAALLFLAATGFTTQRYEVDFLPLLALVGLSNAALLIDRTSGLRRAVLRGTLLAAIGWGAVTNLALGISGPYGEMLKKRPVNYLRIARWFSPLDRFRPRLNPRVTVGLEAEFTSMPVGAGEPLVVMGHHPFQYLLYADCPGGNLRLVSLYEHSATTYPIGSRRAVIRVTFDPDSGKLTASVNGQQAAVHAAGALVMAPAEITVGENRAEPGLTAARFTGRLRYVVVDVRP